MYSANQNRLLRNHLDRRAAEPTVKVAVYSLSESQQRITWQEAAAVVLVAATGLMMLAAN